MVTVKFLGPAEIRDAAGMVTESYAKGAIVDLSPDRARRWIRRGKAAAYQPPPAESPAASSTAGSGSRSRAGKARRSRSSGPGRASPPPTSPDSAAASE